MKIDWKRTLTSRKLWVAATGFIAGIIALPTEPDEVNNT